MESRARLRRRNKARDGYGSGRADIFRVRDPVECASTEADEPADAVRLPASGFHLSVRLAPFGRLIRSRIFAPLCRGRMASPSLADLATLSVARTESVTYGDVM